MANVFISSIGMGSEGSDAPTGARRWDLWRHLVAKVGGARKYSLLLRLKSHVKPVFNYA